MQFVCTIKGCITICYLLRFGIPFDHLGTPTMALKAGRWQYYIPGDRTYPCILTFIVLFRLPVTHWMDSGKISDIQENTSIRCVNLVRLVHYAYPTRKICQ